MYYLSRKLSSGLNTPPNVWLNCALLKESFPMVFGRKNIPHIQVCGQLLRGKTHYKDYNDYIIYFTFPYDIKYLPTGNYYYDTKIPYRVLYCKMLIKRQAYFFIFYFLTKCMHFFLTVIVNSV